MSSGIKHIIKHIVCWILVLQILNLSINSRQTAHSAVSSVQSESLGAQETETLYELISEGVFNTDLPDSDEEDDIDSSSPAIDLYLSDKFLSKISSYRRDLQHTSRYSKRILFTHTEILSPPPRLV